MDLSAPEMHYFIHSVYDAALTLGVQGPDLVTHVGDAISIGVGLDNIFNKQCAPPIKVAPYQESALQDMCGDPGYVLSFSFFLLPGPQSIVNFWGRLDLCADVSD